MWEICILFIDVFVGKLDVVVVCVVFCIYVFVEIDKWKYVCEEMVYKVCYWMFVVLGEKFIWIVVYLYFICLLVLVNFDIISSYGGSLLRVVEEILKVIINFW